MLYWVFGLECYFHICSQHPPICQTAKLCAKIRILKFGTKNALIGCFGEQF